MDSALVPVRGRTLAAFSSNASGLDEHCWGGTVLGDGAYINTAPIVPYCKRLR